MTDGNLRRFFLDALVLPRRLLHVQPYAIAIAALRAVGWKQTEIKRKAVFVSRGFEGGRCHLQLVALKDLTQDLTQGQTTVF